MSAGEEKKVDLQQVERAPSNLGMDGEAPPELTAAQERALWRKIDRRLLPMLSLMYLCSFLDRGNIGNAKLQGLTDQLALDGNKYNIALTMYFIPYCLFECPANLVLKLFKPSRWLPGITIVWGIIMTLMGIVKNYPSLVGARVALGIAEAGLFPGVVYYLTLWYPRHMMQYRIGLFFGAATLAGAFSGLLAFGIGYMSGTAGLLGWSWIFILEGMATVVVGVAALFVLVDYPETATFLTEEEKRFIHHRKLYDSSSSGLGEDSHFHAKYIWAAFKDWQIWMHILVYFSIVTPLYGISLFLPSIIKGFGYSTPISQLLTVPPYFFATLVLFVFAHYSDRLRLRFPFILAALAMCAVGFAINMSSASTGAKYFGTFLVVAGAYGGFPGVVAWLGNNIAGQGKRAVGMALHIGIGNFGGAIASNIYRTQDGPRYVLGHAIELIFVGVGFLALPAIIFSYRRINASREKKLAAGEWEKFSIDEKRAMGDRALDFRYTL